MSALLDRRPALAGAAGALMIAFSAILVRVSEASPSTAAVFRCLYALPVLGALAAWERRRYGPRPWDQRRIALLAGVLFAADLTFWHHSIGAVGAGLATVLGNTQVIVVGLLAWIALRERPERNSLVAVPVVLAGIVLISGVVGAGAYGRDPAFGVLTGVLTAISYAVFILLLRAGNRDRRRPGGPLFDATLVATVAAALGGWALGDLDAAPSWPAHGWLALLALTSQVAGWLLISLALPRLPALLTSIMITLQPVGSVILGVVLLGEAPSEWQFAGVALILSGVVIASARRTRPEAPGREPLHAGAPVAEPASAR